jgi:hypothetical protein
MTSPGEGQTFQQLAAAIAVAVFLVVSAAAGFAVGATQATTEQQATAAKLGTMETEMAKAARSARERALVQGRKRGRVLGATRGAKVGTMRGGQAGHNQADNELAAIAEAEAEAEAAANALEYSDQLPNNRPGYLLPEDQRTPGCVGYDATTGECVGD